jgi:glutamine---fructose-6-phosphate transaminase (isomerizing)
MAHPDSRLRCETFARDMAEEPGALETVLAAYGGESGPLSGLRRWRGLAESRWLFTGMGSSYNACLPAAWWLRKAGITAWVEYASEVEAGRLWGDWTLVVVSQSGTTPEVLGAMEKFRASGGGPVIAVTNREASPVASGADVLLPLLAGAEGDVAAKSYAAGVAVLTLLAGHILDNPEGLRATDLAGAAQASAGILEEWPRLADEMCEALAGDRTVLVLGSQAGRAAAEEGALILKEAGLVPAEGIVTAEFLHGAIYMAGKRLTAVLIPGEADGWSDSGARRWLLDEGATLIEIGGRGPSTLRFPIAELQPAARPLVEALPLELAASHIWRTGLPE